MKLKALKRYMEEGSGFLNKNFNDAIKEMFEVCTLNAKEDGYALGFKEGVDWAIANAQIPKKENKEVKNDS